jgi:hypothetical protein
LVQRELPFFSPLRFLFDFSAVLVSVADMVLANKTTVIVSASGRQYSTASEARRVRTTKLAKMMLGTTGMKAYTQ